MLLLLHAFRMLLHVQKNVDSCVEHLLLAVQQQTMAERVS